MSPYPAISICHLIKTRLTRKKQNVGLNPNKWSEGRVQGL